MTARFSHTRVVLALLGVAVVGQSACGGDTNPSGTHPTVTSERQAIPPSLVARTWQVRLADDKARAPFEAVAGWAHLFKREYGAALQAFSGDSHDALGVARMQMEFAALYREAARLAANATLQVYGADREAGDPPQVDYLVGVSAALSGDCAGAAKALKAARSVDMGPLAQATKAWSGWVDAGCKWPPDPSLGGYPGAPSGDASTDATDAPHFEFPEQSDQHRMVSVGDPTYLYLLSRWHEAAAREAAGDLSPAVDAWLAPWSLPIEPAALPPAVQVPDAWLFAGFLTAPEDLSFLAAAHEQGIAAIDAWADQSPLAAAVKPAVVNGHIDVDKMLDQSAWLGRQVQDAMAARAGHEATFHRAFADLARVGALRAAMVVAGADGKKRDAGILRLNALDRSTGTAADPVFQLSVAAWDTGNRNPLRAQEILHRLIKQFPPLETARYPLDAMHIRLSRNAAPATPVH